MARDFDGWAIAQQRIAKEARERTGKLDLAGLGLEEIPKEVAGLGHLRELDLGWPYKDEAQELTETSFAFNFNKFNDLSSLMRLIFLRSLDFRSTRVADLAPLANLIFMRSLNFSSTPVADLAPLARLTSLQSLNCFGSLVADLGTIARLTSLESFDCSNTRVTDFAPLTAVTSLQSLDCAGTEIADLTPLTDLAELRTLKCWRTGVTDLLPLAALTALRSLDCSSTQVADLAPLARLTSLHSLDCSSTQVAYLAPLAGLTSLRSLDCSFTRVADLTPLAGMTSLQSLDCRSTQVADLTPLARVTSLQSLLCSKTGVVDVAPLITLGELTRLEADELTLDTLPRVLIEAEQLTYLSLFRARIPDIPAGILSSLPREICIRSLRAYFLDSGPDDPRVEDVKLMVLGNGRVGKTQLCCNLLGEPFEPKSDSTHGVTIKGLSLPRPRGPPVHLHIWDFGAQDIYHGTHALFLRDHAIFALVWAKGFEQRDRASNDGELFGHRPLRYWVDYVRHLGGKEQAAVVVQTRCDEPEDVEPCPVSDAELKEAFGRWSIVDFSAKTQRGEAYLRERLLEAAEFALKQEGTPKIPLAWSHVKAALESLREEDQKRPIGERRHRTLTTDAFAAICRDQGVKSEPKHLLNYLHRTGVVFHRPDWMKERIVLDQAWALEAIYAVFERGGAYFRIKGDRGRFWPSDLAITAWKDRSEADRALFLDMMRECGVCFRLRKGDPDSGEEPGYIAPELLPTREKVAVLIDSLWNISDAIHERRYVFPFLHDGLIRAVISEIGDIAGVDGVYWGDGVGVYEAQTQARALIEQIMGSGWSGEIVVKTRGGRAEELLDRLSEIVDRTRQRIGLEGEIKESERPRQAPEGNKAPLAFRADPNAKPRYYVSYAWADKGNPDREKEVDATCERAEKRGTPILRDKIAMKLGDSISESMAAIGRGDRVFVFLSEKYLGSDFCMTELTRLWIDCRTDKDEFHRRSRVFALPDAKFRTLGERAALAKYWSDHAATLRASATGPTGTLLGDADYGQVRWIERIAHHIGDILHLFADRLQPKDFAEFLKYGFDDPAERRAG